MRKLLILLVPSLIMTACIGPPTTPPPATLTTASPLPAASPTSTIPVLPTVPQPEPISTEASNDMRFNFLILGGDYRKHREGTRWGNKTDVMFLVSIEMTNYTVTVYQFNRNFYAPVEAMDDQWLFAVYDNEGFPGLHYYFQEVFDTALTGIVYVNMDNFTHIVDHLNGLWIGGEPRSGEWVLAYLRDNDNNWGCGVYDCESRQFFVLLRLFEAVKQRFVEDDPLETASLLWEAYRDLVETDLSAFDQFHFLVNIAWHMLTDIPPQINGPIKMDQSDNFVYGDTPLEVRGWIIAPEGDAANWIKENLH